MPNRIIQVDAFVDTSPGAAIFSGNPAAVALLDDTPDDDHLQALALEMNLSETAFPVARSDGDWDLRWFTPQAEVDLCGHATLATAHVLFDEGLAGRTDSADGGTDGDAVTFHTRSGTLTCRRADGAIIMDFPAAPAERCEPVEGLAEALGVEVVDQGRSFDLLAQLDTPITVAELSPDIGGLAEIDTRAIVVTAAGDVEGGSAHFVSRVFAPRVGVPEDPVTGSAHCITGPWWAGRLGSNDLLAHQVSARGGSLGVRMKGDRVELTGRAVTIMEGTLIG